MGVKGYAAPEVEPVQNRCIEICRHIGGAPLFAVLAANWEYLFIRGWFARSHPRGPELVKLAEELKGPGLLAEAYWPSSCTAFYAGNYPEACRCAELGARHHDHEASIEFAKITQQNSGPLNLSYHGASLWHRTSKGPHTWAPKSAPNATRTSRAHFPPVRTRAITRRI